MTSTEGWAPEEIPIGWRLKIALERAGVGAQEMADELGVHRATITRWMNVHGVPIRPAYLKQWALRCGVRYDWLATGACEPSQLETDALMLLAAEEVERQRAAGLDVDAAEEFVRRWLDDVRSRRDLNPRPSPCKVVATTAGERTRTALVIPIRPSLSGIAEMRLSGRDSRVDGASTCADEQASAA